MSDKYIFFLTDAKKEKTGKSEEENSQEVSPTTSGVDKSKYIFYISLELSFFIRGRR